jgi:cell division protein FtsL
MMKKRLIQAYKMVPWRKQMQWIGLSLLGIVTISIMAWLYLSISSKTSIAGREIQDLQSEQTKAEQAIAAMETNLAEISSSVEMAKRAENLGFEYVDPTEFEYMVVPGYGGKPTAKLAPETLLAQVESDGMRSEFTRSLWDWVVESYVEPALDK